MAYKESAILTLPTDSKEHVMFGGPASFTSRYMKVTPRDIGKRMFASLGPPFCERFRRTDLDLVGPLLAIALLVLIVHYGYTIKDPAATNEIMAPISSVVLYALFYPCLGFVMCKAGRAHIAFWDLGCLLGYALYSHILTLSLSFLIYQEESNAFFFICLFLFGGSSALRLCIILIPRIPKPAARLLICSTLFIIHLLYLIFLHFAYMHPTFVYGVGYGKKTKTFLP